MRLLSIAAVLAAAASAAASTLTPPVLPLIVRNPYLSTWLANARKNPWESWPMFYTGQEVGLSAMIRISSSGTIYPLLGRPQDSLPRSSFAKEFNISYPTFLGSSFDASTTNLTYSIPHQGSSLEVRLVFLSPVTPTSTQRQSIPAGYVLVEVDGKVDLDFYIDVNGLWATGDRGSKLEWAFKTSGKDELKSWSVWKSNQQHFTEFNDRSEWGTFHLTGPSNATHQAGTSSILRQRFAAKGALSNSVDYKFRTVMDEEPVFAFSKSFSGRSSALFTIAHTQEEIIQYASARGLTLMKPLWAAWYFNTDELLEKHYFDYKSASRLAANYSEQLIIDGLRSGSNNYADIVSLSARQVLGATVFGGTAEEPILFLKEISSDGNLQTVDVIYPAFPFFLYTNPRWLAYLLEPLIEHQQSGQYPNLYSMHDLGTHFPNATGHPDGRDEYMPVEECGNMLILGLAVVNSLRYDTPSASNSGQLGAGTYSLTSQESRDGVSGLDSSWSSSSEGEKLARAWIKRSYPLWKQWTKYLVDFSLVPASQLSTDDFAGWLANQTNLALKGIVGIKAMAELAEVAGEKKDAARFEGIARSYIKKWEELAYSRDGGHAKLAYTWYGSWTTLYNMFADSLLCFHLQNSTSTSIIGRFVQRPLRLETEVGFIPRHIYIKQSQFYPRVIQRYGLPLDSRHLYTKSDWEFFAAAVASNKTRTQILDSVALWINETSTDRPLTDLYETEGTGGFPGPNFFARPVVGGHFTFLALERACNGKAVEGLAFLDE